MHVAKTERSFDMLHGALNGKLPARLSAGAAFHAMMERGLNEAKADKSRAASDVFADLKREMQ